MAKLKRATPTTVGDVGNAPNGWAFTKDVGHSDEPEAPVQENYTFNEAMDAIAWEMKHHGYVMEPSPTGRWCGYEVFFKRQLRLQDLHSPDEFNQLIPIYPSVSTDRKNFFSMLRSVVEGLQQKHSGSKPHQATLRAVISCFEDRLSDPKAPVTVMCRGIMPERVQKTITLTGLPGYHKVVPPLSWFPKDLQEYPVRKLLTLFPDAEAEALMLILGRMVAGASMTDTAEGRIQHTMRAMGLIIGEKAGLGKSSFLGYLSNTLELLGYTQSEINSDFNKFGWAQVATSDLAMIDDLAEKTQLQLLSDPRVKTIVSNNRLKTEEKGLAAVDIRATTVILGCSNKTNYAHYIGLDAGVLSRLNQLYTYTTDELPEVHGTDRDYNLRHYWEQECRTYKVSVETFMALLLRRSLDLFLEVCGLYFDDNGRLQYDHEKNVLEPTFRDLRSRYRIDVNLRHAEELPEIAARLLALTIASKARKNNLDEWLAAVPKIDFSPALMLSTLRAFTQGYTLEGTAFAGVVPKHLSYSVIDYVNPKVNEFTLMQAKTSISKHFSYIVAELLSTKGFGYPQKISYYQSQWDCERRSVRSLVSTYRELLEEEDIPLELDPIIGQIYQLFKHTRPSGAKAGAASTK